jgi:hypothetical protein
MRKKGLKVALTHGPSLLGPCGKSSLSSTE